MDRTSYFPCWVHLPVALRIARGSDGSEGWVFRVRLLRVVVLNPTRARQRKLRAYLAPCHKQRLFSFVQANQFLFSSIASHCMPIGFLRLSREKLFVNKRRIHAMCHFHDGYDGEDDLVKHGLFWAAFALPQLLWEWLG